MEKNSALMNRMRSFADRISGVTRVDNAANPTSAYSMARRKESTAGKTPTFNFAAKQKTYGTPKSK